MRALFTRLQFDRPTSQNIGRPGFYALVTRITPAVAAFVTNVLIGRFSGPILLGQAQAALSTASLASVLGPTSAGSSVSKYVAVARGAASTQGARDVAAYIARFAFAASVALTLIVGAALTLLNMPLLTVIVSSLMVLGVSARAFIEGAQFGAQQVERAASWSTLISILSTLSVAVLLMTGTRDISVLLPLALLNIVYAAATWPSMRGPLPPRTLRRAVLRFSGLAMVGTLASTGLLQASVLVAQAKLGDDYTGLYSVAITLSAPITILAGALTLVLFPILAASHGAGDTAAVRSTTNGVSDALATIAIPLLIGLVFLGRPLIALLWGEEFVSAYPIMVLIAAAMIVTALANPAVSSLTTGNNRGMLLSASSATAGAVAGISSWFLLLPLVPTLAIPVGFLLGTLLTSGIPYAVAWRTQQQRWLGRTLICGIAIVALIVTAMLPETAHMPLWLSMLVLVGALALWLLIRRRSVRLLLSALRR